MPPPPPGRLANVMRVSSMIWLGGSLHWKAFKESYRHHGVAGIFRFQEIHDAAVANLLSMTSDGFIAFENTTTVPSLVKCATGRVLELGPGPGNQIHRYDPAQIEFVYAVDPNPHFAIDIAAKLQKVGGLDDKYKFIACGIEDSDVLRNEGITEGSLDSITSIQVMCAVDDVRPVMKEIYKLLKPGGKFVFWEHGRSKNTLTALAQALWNPAWYRFVGCSMTRDVKAGILAAGEWENPNDIKQSNDPYGFLPRVEGVLIKKI
ncbi:methyltransferase type 11 [Xylariaceae sp. FL1019]|nr:methyltransferase type 11 [Xylariaceae sp. FL1019]